MAREPLPPGRGDAGVLTRLDRTSNISCRWLKKAILENSIASEGARKGLQTHTVVLEPSHLFLGLKLEDEAASVLLFSQHHGLVLYTRLTLI